MKKVIFTLSMIVLTVAVFAQQPVKIYQQNPASQKVAQKVLNGRETGEAFSLPAPMVRNTEANYIGSTYYDLQTNSSMGSRIIAHEDGTVSYAWTTCGTASSSRGTGYNYFSNGSLVNDFTSTARIETARTGWGNLAPLGTGTEIGEIVVAHNGSTGLVVSTRPTKGTGVWNSQTLIGPSIINGTSSSTALLWPTMATSGNTVHLFACTESDAGYLYEGIQTALVYYRGTYDRTSNSVTWENPRLIDGIDSSYIGEFDGDAYRVKAQNGKVVLLVCGSTADVFYCESNDGGTTWTKTIVFDSPVPEGYASDESLLLDTPFVCDGSGSLAIDESGNVHVAFGITRILEDDLNTAGHSYFPGYDALLYWNSTMPQITQRVDTPAYSLNPDYLLSQGRIIFSRPDLDGDDTLWYLNGGIENYPSYGIGMTSQPQLVVKDGTVYLIFSSVLDFPFYDYDQTMYYRGIFGTKSTDNGTTWSMDSISWLSYGEDIYYVDWDLLPTTENPIDAIFTNSENVYVAAADEIVNGKVNMIWQTDYFAGSEIKENNSAVCNNIANINWLQINASEIGSFNNTTEVHTGIWDEDGICENSLSEMKMYPNPASTSVIITVNSLTSSQATLSVTNLMGQTVYTNAIALSSGANQLTLNVSELSNGFYMVNIKSNTGTTTQKLIVR